MVSRMVCHAIAGAASCNSLHQFGLHLEPAIPERGERAGRAAEFADQHAFLELSETLAMALEARKQRGHFVAEGDRHRPAADCCGRPSACRVFAR
jgi:hypothetical protein